VGKVFFNTETVNVTGDITLYAVWEDVIDNHDNTPPADKENTNTPNENGSANDSNGAGSTNTNATDELGCGGAVGIGVAILALVMHLQQLSFSSLREKNTDAINCK
jgi:hypothetical protein